METALAAGKPVVTANKALLARHGHKLATLAERQRVALNFEASVAGGIPIVKTLREGLNGNAFTRIYGILNGTCNYILSRMERGASRVRGLPARGAAARLCGGRSVLRRRRATTPRKSSPFWRALPSAPKSIEAAVYRRRHLVDHARRSRCRGRARLPRQAVRRRGAHRSRHRAARASDHGAEGVRDRAGDGRDQRGDGRRRRPCADHAGRARRRRHGDRFRRRFRSGRYRARRAHSAVRAVRPRA